MSANGGTRYLLRARITRGVQTSAARMVAVIEWTTAEDERDSMAEGEKFQVDPAGDPHPGVPDHALPDDADGPHPLADPAKHPTPGVPRHAKDE